jgi:integration host factor subunit alpha
LTQRIYGVHAPKVLAILGFPKNQSTDIIESLLEIIKSTLASGEDVLISGFGKFCVNEKRERRGRNPAILTRKVLSRNTVSSTSDII